MTLGIIKHGPNGKPFVSNGWALELRQSTGYSIVRKEGMKGHVCTADSMSSMLVF